VRKRALQYQSCDSCFVKPATQWMPLEADCGKA
jgi:hypothetical protein